MNAPRDAHDAGAASGSAVPPAMPNYPHNIHKEVTVKGK